MLVMDYSILENKTRNLIEGRNLENSKISEELSSFVYEDMKKLVKAKIESNVKARFYYLT